MTQFPIGKAVLFIGCGVPHIMMKQSLKIRLTIRVPLTETLRLAAIASDVLQPAFLKLVRHNPSRLRMRPAATLIGGSRLADPPAFFGSNSALMMRQVKPIPSLIYL